MSIPDVLYVAVSCRLGQPRRLSRVIARILGIRHAKVTSRTAVYDPTCGSGSLLLEVADDAAHGRNVQVTLYGQEKDNATVGLARMNMILHGSPTASSRATPWRTRRSSTGTR